MICLECGLEMKVDSTVTVSGSPPSPNENEMIIEGESETKTIWKCANGHTIFSDTSSFPNNLERK